MRYFFKRLGIFILTLLLVSIVIFLAFQIIPGDPTTRMLGTEATPEKVAALRTELGLDQPIYVRYFDWLKGFVTGDFGTSFTYNMPVGELLAGKLPITGALALMAFGMVVVIAIPLGVLLARFAHGVFDRIFMVLNQIVMSIPPFFLGIVFTYVFGLILKLFTPGDFVSADVDAGAFWSFLIFPALAIALPRSAAVIKMLRSSMLTQMNEGYVRTAYSRGNSPWQVLSRHVLRNAMVPVVTFLAVTLVDIVAGTIIIEQVFAIPGMGRLLLSSIIGRDYPVVQTIVMIIAALVLFINYFADISNKYIDPRLRYRS